MSEVKTNKITSLASNNDITLDPDGTGDVVVAAGHSVGIGTAAPDEYVHIKGASGAATDVQIQGGDDTNSVRLFMGGSSNRLNGRIVYDVANNAMALSTNGDERLRVDSNGHTLFGQSSTDSPGVGNTTAGAAIRGTGISFFSASGSAPGRFNRSGDDGALIVFYQAGTQEGTISVSGTTVSYNGGHLARFSQATDSNRIDGLVKGTVMTNLDQMAVWTKDGVTEDNEQLNCMAVSSVEGDANVAGVFVNWDDDDEDYTSDMNIAMTGDMVIRIASGTTVARGDLLMSAGDGTAKPQDDDIVRSKTIAKVTSTTKSHTYDDGSYLVPCVLMAC